MAILYSDEKISRTLTILESAFKDRLMRKYSMLVDFEEQLSSEPISPTKSVSRLSQLHSFRLTDKYCFDRFALKYANENPMIRFMADRFIYFEEFFTNAVFTLGIRPVVGFVGKFLSIKSQYDHERALQMFEFSIRVAFHDTRFFAMPMSRQMIVLVPNLESCIKSRFHCKSNNENIYDIMARMIFRRFGKNKSPRMRSQNFDAKAKELLGEHYD